MKQVPKDLLQCIVIGLTLRDYAVLSALVMNRSTPMTRQDIEASSGLSEAVVWRSTKRMVEMKLIARDKKHEVGGSRHRAAKYFLA